MSAEPSPSQETQPGGAQEAEHSSGALMSRLRGKAAALFAEIRARLKQRRAIAIILAGLVMGFAGLVYMAVFLTVAGIAPDERAEQTVDALLISAGIASVLLLAVIGWVIARFFVGHRKDRPGSRLSASLIVQFALVAALPIGMSALLAGTLFLGIESWFSERTQKVLDNSRAVAAAYLKEHEDQMLSNVSVLASYIDVMRPLLETDEQRFKQYLASQAQLLKLLGTYMVDSNNKVLAGALDPRVDTNIKPLPPEAFQAAAMRPLVQQNEDRNQMVALIKLEAFDDAYLFAARRIDPRVPELINQTDEAFTTYRSAEQSRMSLQWLYALTFFGMALVVSLIAMLMALRSARRIADPLSRLVVAADHVSRGDLTARVDAGRRNDEVATLGRAFNRMTAELQSQRNELVETNTQYDRRRRFIEAVMSGVTAGVIGLDTNGKITLTNKSARTLLDVTDEELVGKNIRDVLTNLAPLFLAAKNGRDQTAQGEIDLIVDGHTRNLMVRVTSEPSVDDSGGYVVTFDDITELVSAQRMSAWADVARRIAHEIKNPLTPIQLSAERLRRKYGKEITSQPEIFEQCTQTIIRQVGDIGRMVDEFSSFARMPEAVMKPQDMGELVRQAAFLERVGHPEVKFDVDLPKEKVTIECDGRQVSQALINVLKNAAEAVGTRLVRDGEPETGAGGEELENNSGGDQKAEPGRIVVKGTLSSKGYEIAIIDNGVGLPKDDRNRLTEPYMTTRAKGTGLGLAIVKKIMEDHGGSLALADAPVDYALDSGHRGAMVRLMFPRERLLSGATAEPDQDQGQKTAKGEAVTS